MEINEISDLVVILGVTTLPFLVMSLIEDYIVNRENKKKYMNTTTNEILDLSTWVLDPSKTLNLEPTVIEDKITKLQKLYLEYGFLFRQKFYICIGLVLCIYQKTEIVIIVYTIFYVEFQLLLNYIDYYRLLHHIF